MSTIVRLDTARQTRFPQVGTPRLALLGTGVVGRAFVARYLRLRAAGLALPEFGWLANSRALHVVDADIAGSLEQANAAPARDPSGLPLWAENASLGRGDVVVDATASETVADWHAEWLARGIHVVTANKLGNGSALHRARHIRASAQDSGASYGDSATVGAGLPLLRSLRTLVAGGDAIHRVEGVLSGSLAWLFNRYDGSQSFSSLVREARQAGYTEPDPRIDLSGEDVRRKLLILARAAGYAFEPEDVRVDSLVPPALAGASAAELDGALAALDAPLEAQFRAAAAQGRRLRFVGQFDRHSARVGLQALPADHPLCGGSGTDNRVAISSDRYDVQPLLIQGPGAGAEVTAAALLDDVLALQSGHA